MDKQRLKIKIGEFELDTEGPEETLQARLEAFKELVMHASMAVSAPAKPEIKTENGIEPPKQQLEKILQQDDRIVSLTVRPETIDDAVLLLLYGQRVLRSNSTATGNEVMQGLRVSGQRVDRVDRLLEKASIAGDVIVIGQHRAKRYRLTNSGLAKANDIAQKLIETVA
jgi:hypothetical protein